MSVVKKNIIANILGKGFSAILSVIFVPIYLRYLGAEAYGIVGVFATLQSVFMLADMGLSGTFTRETARLSVMEDGAQHIRNLCRTFESIFTVFGFLIVLIIGALSRLIAEHWVNLEHLSVPAVSNSIILIGIAVGLQFPFVIYQGGLLGLQRQMHLNGLLLSLGFVRGLGAVLILKFVDSSIQAFFIWQVAVSAIQLMAGYLLVWRSLPPTPDRPRFDLHLIRPLWRFAAGTAGITLSGILLMQADKIILTKILSMEKFGYYTLAGVVASVPGMVAMPFNNAIYPRFTQLVAMKDIPELTALYHRSCQLLSVLIIPVGLILAIFSKEIVFLWTGNNVTAQNTFLLIRILVTGSTLMGLMLIPYALQLAYGWTRLSLMFNVVGVIFLVPSMIWLTKIYGAVGASFMWLVLSTGYFVGLPHLMHRHILQSEKWKWYIEDIGKPFIFALVIVLFGSLFVQGELSKLSLFLRIFSISVASVCSSAMSIKLIRARFLKLLCK